MNQDMVAAGEVAEVAKRTGLKFSCAIGPFCIALQPRKAILSRRDLPRPAHLTLAWGNTSGEIDLHLTFDGVELDERYEPLGKVHESAADAVGDRIRQALDESIFTLANQWMPVTPGWLWRKRYWVLLTEPKQVERALLSLAPKQRGKHRVKSNMFANADWARGFVDYQYKPQILNYLTADERLRPITAMRTRKGKADILHLGAREHSDGRISWRALSKTRSIHLSNLLTLRALEVIVKVLHPGLLAKIDRIDKALELSSVEFMRALVDAARQVVQDPEFALAKFRRQVPPKFLR